MFSFIRPVTRFCICLFLIALCPVATSICYLYKTLRDSRLCSHTGANYPRVVLNHIQKWSREGERVPCSSKNSAQSALYYWSKAFARLCESFLSSGSAVTWQNIVLSVTWPAFIYFFYLIKCDHRVRIWLKICFNRFSSPGMKLETKDKSSGTGFLWYRDKIKVEIGIKKVLLEKLKEQYYIISCWTTLKFNKWIFMDSRK